MKEMKYYHINGSTELMAAVARSNEYIITWMVVL